MTKNKFEAGYFYGTNQFKHFRGNSAEIRIKIKGHTNETITTNALPLIHARYFDYVNQYFLELLSGLGPPKFSASSGWKKCGLKDGSFVGDWDLPRRTEITSLTNGANLGFDRFKDHWSGWPELETALRSTWFIRKSGELYDEAGVMYLNSFCHPWTPFLTSKYWGEDRGLIDGEAKKNELRIYPENSPAVTQPKIGVLTIRRHGKR